MTRYVPVIAALVAAGCQPAHPNHLITPAYPMLLRSAMIEGRVRVRISVSPSGIPERIVVDSAVGAKSLFARAVERAVRRSLFAPARRFGIPVRGTAEFPVRFVLLRPTSPPDATRSGPGPDSLRARCPPASEPTEVMVCAPVERPRRAVLY